MPNDKYKSDFHKRSNKSYRDAAATNLIEFSFFDNKYLFEPLLLCKDKRNCILEDKMDFWKFVNKYENMLKSAEQYVLKPPLAPKDYNNLTPYHRVKCIALRLNNVDLEHINYANDSLLTPGRIREFQEIILIYMDFKQKEKFSRIKALRKAQASLPIYQFKTSLAEALNETQVLIVAGDTGCGKSTQVPQYLYEFGYRNIACTQPRRLACVSLSKRVAHEMLDDYGSKVGFQIRFEKSRTANTNILFITEGLLLRQLALESNLDQYDVLILDEIHERNLFGDFLLGVTKCLLRAKPNLKLILMSATINVELFHQYFKDENVKLLQVPGRLHPIKTVYMPPAALELQGKSSRTQNSSASRLDPQPFVQILNLIDEKYSVNERGDVLIFVSGVNEITTVCDAIKEYSEQQQHWIILPLHSGLSLTEQDKVFDYAPDGMRKCIVSTNIAETSLTVDGVRFVIDSGKVKEMNYDASCKGQRLKEYWVSKSSAEQRKGRAGRTGPGTCFRLFSEKQFDTFESYPTPEIFRVPLDTILLQMISMGLPNVRQFPFIEMPDNENIEQTIYSLKQHKALTNDEKITTLGKSLSNLPVEIAIGKMLLMGCVFPDMEKILTLAAIFSVQNPFTTRAYTDSKCEEARSDLETDQGDVFILLKAFHEWLQLKVERDNTRKWCYKLGIEEQRFYEITKLRNQFQNILEDYNMNTNKSSNEQLSSSERARRNGEMRFLKAIKRKQKYLEPRQRKVLKRNSSYGTNESDFEDANDGDDIRDVDFRLRNNSDKMNILLKSSAANKSRDVLLLKLIIVSGFYPHIAIADEFNYCKGGTQQFFHTNLKSFISIHPNAYFAKYYDVLKLNDSNILEKPSYYTPKQQLSEDHQILCYQNLLETAKPYLMNCIRLPAAQALLLFSYSIDTNESITRIVCDSWLCLEFPIPESGCQLLCKAIELRRRWEKLLMEKLAELNANDCTNQKQMQENIDLWQDLIDFMHTRVAFTIKRLLPADQKSLYSQQPLDNAQKFFKRNPFAKDYNVSNNEEKGGINIAANVVYGCLEEPNWCINMETELHNHTWQCQYCNMEMPFDVIQKLLHKMKCKQRRKIKGEEYIAKDKCQQSSATSASTASSSSSATSTVDRIQYSCPHCHKDLLLKQIDILKHRKTCSKAIN